MHARDTCGLTGDLPIGFRGRLPVDYDGARLVLFAHHGHVFRGRAGSCGRRWGS